MKEHWHQCGYNAGRRNDEITSSVVACWNAGRRNDKITSSDATSVVACWNNAGRPCGNNAGRRNFCHVVEHTVHTLTRCRRDSSRTEHTQLQQTVIYADWKGLSYRQTVRSLQTSLAINLLMLTMNTGKLTLYGSPTDALLDVRKPSWISLFLCVLVTSL